MWIKLTADFKYCYLLFFFFFFSLQWQDCCISAPAQHLWNSAGASTWSHQESLTQVTKILVFNSSCISPNHEIFSNTDNRLGNSLFFFCHSEQRHFVHKYFVTNSRSVQSWLFSVKYDNWMKLTKESRTIFKEYGKKIKFHSQECILDV